MIGRFPTSGVVAQDGRLALTGTAAALRTWLDDRFRAMAAADAAVECHFPSSLSRDVLTRASYFESFPDGATRVGVGPRADYFLSPAVCFHVYALLADRTLDAPLVITAAQNCFREADRRPPEEGAADDGVGRLWEFSMREVVFVGPGPWVTAQQRRWSERALAFAREVGLAAVLEPATDAFYGDLSRGQRLIQQLKHLKDELRVEIGASSVAAASFNLHERFFGERFAIRLDDGSVAHSGCAAFGLERWALALLSQRGEDGARSLLGG